MIYLDNAATTLHKPPQVAQAVCRAMDSFGNSGRGTHEEALDASRIIYETREQLAQLFHCSKTDHVCFTANSTEALNLAIAGTLNAGEHVLSTDLEHNSVLRPLYRFASQGGSVDFAPADWLGNLADADFAKLLRPETRAVICTHASNLTGNVLNLEKIGAFCRSNDLLFIVDASQTAGSLPIDMEKMHIDILCFTGHKSLMGPQGTGGICVAENVEIRPWKVGGTGVQSYLKTQPKEYPTRLEAGTLNGHGIAGLHAALNFIQATGMDHIHAHEMEMMQAFYERVVQISGVKVYGDFSGAERVPIVSLNIGDLESGEVSDALSQQFSIATRPGAHCAPRLHRALGTEEQGAVRFSWSWFNTMEETETAANAVRILAEELQ